MIGLLIGFVIIAAVLASAPGMPGLPEILVILTIVVVTFGLPGAAVGALVGFIIMSQTQNDKPDSKP